MSEHTFDPEVLALLDEIARSPEGQLLRVPRRKLASYIGDPKETVAPHGTYLSRAERHVVGAYREEASRVLLEACILQLKRDPLIYTSLKSDEGALRRKARELVPRLSGEAGGVATLRALSGEYDLTATQLAVASIRLAPCDLGFNALAQCYLREGWWRASLRSLERFQNESASNYQRAQAFANVASVHAFCGDFRQAFEANCRACRLDAHHSRFAVWGFAMALQGGDKKSALVGARFLDECEESSDFNSVLDGIAKARRSGAWAPTRASRRLISGLRVSLSTKIGAICDSFS